MEKWTFGNFLNDSYQNEFQQGYLEITPDAGIPFRREIFSDIQDIVSGNISLDNGAYLDFMSWYKYNIRQGTLPFLFYDCRVQTERVARLTIEKPQYSRNSNRWNVSVTIIFDSGAFYPERVLVCNEVLPLEADGKTLTVNVKRYL